MIVGISRRRTCIFPYRCTVNDGCPADVLENLTVAAVTVTQTQKHLFHVRINQRCITHSLHRHVRVERPSPYRRTGRFNTEDV